MYDARIGRTLSPDPYGQFASPYAWVGNNPVSGVDPNGGWCTTCLAQLGQSIQNMMGTMLDAVTVTASRSVASGAVASGIGNVILRDGFKTWTNQGLMIEPNFPSFQQSSPRQEQWSNYNANLSTPGLSSMPSPSTSLSGSISSYLPSAETLQTGLGVAGWIPGVQTIAGIAEAGVALYRGEYLGATLALAGAVPVVGYLAKFAKSSRFLLQAHHVIPRAVIRNFNLNSVTGFAADGLKNIKRLPFPFHASHYQYNLYVTRELEKLGGNINLPALTKLQNQLKVEIRNAWRIHKQGGGNLNDYFRTLN
jgi:hypothetical protein